MSNPNNWNEKVIADFRANDGRVGGPFEGAPMVLVHHRGRRTGHEYVNPMMYLPSERGDGAIYVFASKGGAPTNPDWYHNVLANPHVRAEIGTQTYDLVAHEATGEERTRIWEEQKRFNPGFAEYEDKTSRQIPVIVLEPQTASEESGG
jgi:deazaflavin-dependent oxidoreductase (nitroreductase family)